MSAFFSKVFKGKDSAGSSKKSAQANSQETQPAREEDPWLRTRVDPGEIQELLRACTKEVKSRGLSTPFFLLPFRPTADPGSARNFVRSFFNGENTRLSGMLLEQELRLTDPMVLCSVLKWCWSRLPGGVVTWETYELFRVGEADSQMARDAFATFIPISVDVEARARIIFDFFDLLSAVAAHAKTNGLAGLKLSRLAGWWAFEHTDSGWGFEGGYKSWTRAADATMHLFFAYLRSLSPTDPGKGAGAVPMLPTSLRALLASVDYPPQKQIQLHSKSVKVVMTVETVSPTPFALLRRAKHFQFRDDDKALQIFAQAEDPIQVLTEECKRVLRCISAINESSSSTFPISNGGQSWLRFEDMGFSGVTEEEEEPAAVPEEPTGTSASGESFGESFRKRAEMGPSHRTGDILARPTTPSWADFMITGFSDRDPTSTNAVPLLLPPDKVLPPIDTASSRVRSSQSNRKHIEDSLDPGELASVTPMNIDDAFWWVWMTSLANEEPNTRKAVFGRCALAETKIEEGRWLVIEEKVKGAAPALEDSAYIATKKEKSKRNRIKLSRRKSVDRTNIVPKVIPGVGPPPEPAKPNISPDAAARVQSVAATLRQQSQRRNADGQSTGAKQRPNSVFTLQPIIMSEATPAMKWASAYDEDSGDRVAIRDAYLKGTPLPPKPFRPEERSLPALPKEAEKVDPKPTLLPPVPITKSSTAPIPPKTQVIPSTPESKRPSSPSAKQTATSPKSVQSSTGSATSPEKARKSMGSRLGKFFGRKSSDIGALSTSRSNTPEPQRAIEKSTQKRGPLLVDSNGKNTTINGTKSPTTEKITLPPIPPKDRPRESNIHLPVSEEISTPSNVYSAFNHGPLTDVPAFVPEDSPEPSIINEPVVPETIVEETNPITPTTSSQVPDASPSSPVPDRWAQIRKNAVERAKKMGDDGPSADTRRTSVDDGETSGEETIESRVARIKARVAELTGNMDNPTRP